VLHRRTTVALIAIAAGNVLSGCLFGGDGSEETRKSAGATFAVVDHQPFGEPPELIEHQGELKARLTASGRPRAAGLAFRRPIP